MDCGTVQVGLTVMVFIVSLSSGVAMLGLPITTRVVHTWAPLCMTLSEKSGWLTIDIGFAEVARIPAPALHVHDDGLDLLGVALRGVRLAAQLRERRLEPAIGLVLRAEQVECLARIRGIRDAAQDVRGLGRRLRQLDVVAHAGIGEAPGLHVPRIGEHRAGELELGLGQRDAFEAGEIRRLVLAGLEAVGIGVLQASDDRSGTRILDALVEPERREIAVLVERLDRRALFLAGKKAVRLRGQEVADLLGDGAIGGIERCQRIGRGSLLGCSGLLR